MSIFHKNEKESKWELMKLSGPDPGLFSPPPPRSWTDNLKKEEKENGPHFLTEPADKQKKEEDEKSAEFVEDVKCNFAIPQNCHLKFWNKTTKTNIFIILEISLECYVLL